MPKPGPDNGRRRRPSRCPSRAALASVALAVAVALPNCTALGLLLLTNLSGVKAPRVGIRAAPLGDVEALSVEADRAALALVALVPAPVIADVLAPPSASITPPLPSSRTRPG